MRKEQYNKRIAYIDSVDPQYQKSLLQRLHDKGFWVYAKYLVKESSSSLNASKE